MTGWLIYNRFLSSVKFNEHVEWFRGAAQSRGVELIPTANDAVPFSVSQCGIRQIADKPVPDFALFWDKDIRLAQMLEAQGMRLFNSSEAIRLCDDKSLTHLALAGKDIPMPETVFAPKTFADFGYRGTEFFECATQRLGFPLVVKEWFGSFGQQVYLARDMDELLRLAEQTAPRPILLQRFVKSSFARDIRINVVGGKAVAAMYRWSENGDFRANVSSGGKMKAYSPSLEESALAVRCCEILGLDFAGVDLLFGEDGPMVCEVNSNAHIKNLRIATGVDCAALIIDWILHSLREVPR